MTDFEIDFALRPLAELLAATPAAARSWGGLSEGSYRLRLGDARLLEYAAGEPVRHAVVRLHEDLLGMLPNVLEPVPADVASAFDEGSLAQTALRLQRALEETGDDQDAALDEELLEAAAVLAGRQLDTSYLEPVAGIWLWRHDAGIRVEWDHRAAGEGGGPTWAATEGRSELDLAAFVAAIESFHERFLAQMEARLGELGSLAAVGSPGEIARDHMWRRGRLEAARSRRADAGDFRNVRAVLAR